MQLRTLRWFSLPRTTTSVFCKQSHILLPNNFLSKRIVHVCIFAKVVFDAVRLDVSQLFVSLETKWARRQGRKVGRILSLPCNCLECRQFYVDLLNGVPVLIYIFLQKGKNFIQMIAKSLRPPWSSLLPFCPRCLAPDGDGSARNEGRMTLTLRVLTLKSLPPYFSWNCFDNQSQFFSLKCMWGKC